MERVILIKTAERTTAVANSKETTAWAQRFNKIIQKVSSTVGEVVRIGQWLHSAAGRSFFSECLHIVTQELGSSSKTVRIAQSAASVLYAARKVRKITAYRRNNIFELSKMHTLAASKK